MIRHTQSYCAQVYGSIRIVAAMILSVIAIASSATTSDSAKLSTAAIIDFETSGLNGANSKAISDRFRIEIFQRKVFSLLEREKMSEILKEQGFQQSGACSSSECLVQAGKLLSVDKIVTGTVSQVGNAYSVSVRVIKVETGEILQTAVVDAQGDVSLLLNPGMSVLACKLAGGSDCKSVETPSKPKEEEGFLQKMRRMDFSL